MTPSTLSPPRRGMPLKNTAARKEPLFRLVRVPCIGCCGRVGGCLPTPTIRTCKSGVPSLVNASASYGCRVAYLAGKMTVQNKNRPPYSRTGPSGPCGPRPYGARGLRLFCGTSSSRNRSRNWSQAGMRGMESLVCDPRGTSLVDLGTSPQHNWSRRLKRKLLIYRAMDQKDLKDQF